MADTMDGDIAAPPAATSTSLTTLDEPVSATIVRPPCAAIAMHGSATVTHTSLSILLWFGVMIVMNDSGEMSGV